MSFVINNGFKRVVTITGYFQADGTPGQIQGVPVWSVSKPSASLVVAPDGMSAEVFYVSPDTAVEVTSVANGDLGTGVSHVTITDVFDMVELPVVSTISAVSGTSTVSDQIPV
jgi:hypothetical protein